MKKKVRAWKTGLIILVGLFLIGLFIWKMGIPLLSPTPRIQNFILLSIDDLRADRLGCYGNERNVSPHMDHLTSEGVQFLNAFISWPMTFRCHTSMLTSIYPSIFSVPLDSHIQTIASILHKQGYKTAAFTGGGYMSAKFGLLNGFEERNDNIIDLGKLRKETIQWLNKNQNKKFFLFLHTYYVHRPFVAPSPFFKEYADPNYSGPIKNRPQSTKHFIDEANAGNIKVNAEDTQRMLDIYDAQIKRIDKFVFRIVKALEQMNLTEKTMFILTSDHGEQFFEFNHFGHTSPLNPFADISTRVPLIVYCPRLGHKGTVQQLVEIIDIPPTICQAAGIEFPKNFQGKSFFPFLRGKSGLPGNKKKEVYFCNRNFLGIRTEKMKLTIELESGKTMLFDLTSDPQERENIVEDLSASKVNSLVEKIRQFQKKNQDLRKKLGISAQPLHKKMKMDKELLKRLRSLGYIK